jgi:hypothetical protein
MANPFDQFDEPVSRGSSAAPPPNPFDQFDAPEPRGGLAANAAAGVNEATLGMVGAPVDALTWAMNLIPRGVNAATGAETLGTIKRPFMGSEMLKEAAGLIGANPDAIQVRTVGERIARGAGAGIASTLLPAAAMSAVPRAAAGSATEMGRMIFGAPDAFNAGVGAAAGAGGAGAAEYVPDAYKPVAATVGGLAGAVGAVAGAGRALGPMGGYLAQRAAPFTAGGRERLAGRVIEAEAENPAAVRQALESGMPELVPGSRPTTFQATGDMGLGGLERHLETQSPAQFQVRRSDQNAARVGALQNVQVAGSPLEVASAVRQSLRALDDAGQGAVDLSTTVAQGRAASIGGDEAPAFYGEQIRGRVQPQLDAATATARDATAALGGDAGPEAYGGAMRDALTDSRMWARERENLLWRAVDPDGRLSLDASPLRQAAVDLRRSLPRSASRSSVRKRRSSNPSLRCRRECPSRKSRRSGRG